MGPYNWWNNPYPDGSQNEPECVHCDDAGCPECCATQPMTLEDIIDLEEQEHG